MREVLPKWGVVWQTKDTVHDEVIRTRCCNKAVILLLVATILGRVKRTASFVLP